MRYLTKPLLTALAWMMMSAIGQITSALAQTPAVPLGPGGGSGSGGGGTPSPIVYPAVTCDGVFNIYPIVQPILTALGAANGGTVQLPAGHCNTNTVLLEPSNTYITGVGVGATYLQSSGPVLSNSAEFSIGNVNIATVYPINTPVQGVASVTTTTASQAGNYAAGSAILIAGPLYDPFNSPYTAGTFTTGVSYTIKTVGTTNFTLIGAANNNIGTIFVATGPGTGTGTAWYNTDFWFPGWYGTVGPGGGNASTGVVPLTEPLPIGGSAYTLSVPIPATNVNVGFSNLTIQSTGSLGYIYQFASGINIHDVQCGAASAASACGEFTTVRNSKIDNISNPAGNPYQVIDCFECANTYFTNSTLYLGAFVNEAGSIDDVFSNLEVINPGGGVETPFNIVSGSQRNKILGSSVINLPASQSALTIGGYANNEGENVIDGFTVVAASPNTNTNEGVTIAASNDNKVDNSDFNGVGVGVIMTSGSLRTLLGTNSGENIVTALYQSTGGSTNSGPYATNVGSGLQTGAGCGGGLVNSLCIGDGISSTINVGSSSYNSGTGLVTLVTNTALNLSPGSLVAVYGAAGTGSFASLNGVFTAGTGTTGSTVTYTIATSLTLTITGANVTNDGVFYNPSAVPFGMGIGIPPATNAKMEVFGPMVVGPGFVGALGSLSVAAIGGTTGFIFFDNSGSQSFGYNGSVFALAGGGLTVASGNLTLTSGQVISSGAVNGSVHISTGSVPAGTTGSCVASSLAGGNTAGSFSAAACVAGTIILTGFPTTAHGYSCDAQDTTTTADTLKESNYSTSSVTFTATTAASDNVTYKCEGF